jgi:hypothetical protein
VKELDKLMESWSRLAVHHKMMSQNNLQKYNKFGNLLSLEMRMMHSYYSQRLDSDIALGRYP